MPSVMIDMQKNIIPKYVFVGVHGDNNSSAIDVALPQGLNTIFPNGYISTIHIQPKFGEAVVDEISLVNGKLYYPILRSITDVGEYTYSIKFVYNDVVWGTKDSKFTVLTRVDGDGNVIETLEPNVLEQMQGGIAKNASDIATANQKIDALVVNGNDRTFYYNQQTPSDNVTITHNLGKMPSVTLIDSAGDLMMGDVKYIDNNSVRIVLSSACAFSATLN